MFNNANVIFRTKFVDGVSAVTRTVVNGRNKAALMIGNGNRSAKENRTNVGAVGSDDETEKPVNKKTKKTLPLSNKSSATREASTSD